MFSSGEDSITPPAARIEASDAANWQKAVSIFTSVAGVAFAAASLLLEREVADIFLLIAALFWGEGPPSNGIPASSPSPSAGAQLNKAGPRVIEAIALTEAIQSNGQNISGTVASEVTFGGHAALRVQFAKTMTFYDVHFDLAKLLGQVRITRFACHVNVANLRGATASWGGVLFMDKDYKQDYGADVVFHSSSEDWLEVDATVGVANEKTRDGESRITSLGLTYPEA